MKTPTNIGGNNLVTWLQSATEIRMADLYTITLKSGTALRYTKGDGYYDNGQIAFTSGANAGLVKAVKSYAAQQFTFNSPLPFPPSAGDAFIAYPGCDKTQLTCTNKFSNLVNFEGFPYVPAPETAI